MAKKKAPLTLDQRAKRLAAQRRAMKKTIRLLGKQMTAHLEEMTDFLLGTAATMQLVAAGRSQKRYFKATVKPGADVSATQLTMAVRKAGPIDPNKGAV